MKRKSVNECIYTLTHIEQFSTCSIVNVTAKLESPDTFEVTQLELLLTLAIEPAGGVGSSPPVVIRELSDPVDYSYNS